MRWLKGSQCLPPRPPLLLASNGPNQTDERWASISLLNSTTENKEHKYLCLGSLGASDGGSCRDLSAWALGHRPQGRHRLPTNARRLERRFRPFQTNLLQTVGTVLSLARCSAFICDCVTYCRRIRCTSECPHGGWSYLTQHTPRITSSISRATAGLLPSHFTIKMESTETEWGFVIFVNLKRLAFLIKHL